MFTLLNNKPSAISEMTMKDEILHLILKDSSLTSLYFKLHFRSI